MARERDKWQWRHTSEVLSLLANCYRDPQKRSTPFKPNDFNPYAEPVVQESSALMVTMEEMEIAMKGLGVTSGSQRN